MKADARRFCKSHDMMVTSMPRTHERDDVLGAVGQPHAERVAEELHAAWHVRGKEQNMAKAHRPDVGCFALANMADRFLRTTRPGPLIENGSVDASSFSHGASTK